LADVLIAEKKLASPRNGYIEWDGKQWTKRAFADMIVEKGLMHKLNEMLAR
jgi:hypothetical protein